MAAGTLHVTGDAAADELLNTDGLALLIGMLLDQQVPMEWAFMGPTSLQGRLGHLDARRSPPWTLRTWSRCSAPSPPAPLSSSHGPSNTRPVAFVVERYDGKAERLWRAPTRAPSCYDRLRELPGYGLGKAHIFVASWPSVGVCVQRLGGRRRALRRPPPLGRRHPTPVPAEVASEEGPEGSQEGQARPPVGA